jgi:hypothetical protein
MGQGEVTIPQPRTPGKEERLFQSVLDLIQERRSHVTPSDLLGHELRIQEPARDGIEEIPHP